MKPIDKAIEIVSDFYKQQYNADFDQSSIYSKKDIKERALIAVDFAINSPFIYFAEGGLWIDGRTFYLEVKQEILKL
jgi:hypothetical protein